MKIITGAERRRTWTEEQKQEIVAAALAPGAVKADVARRYGVGTCSIYRWRQELCQQHGLAEVTVPPTPLAAHAIPDSIEVLLANKGRIRIPLNTPPALAGAIMKAVRS